MTYFPDLHSWGIILVDTLAVPAVRSLPSTPLTVAGMAKTVVHELGHWFATTFLRVKQQSEACTNGHQHFSHASGLEEGCTEGHWNFYGNFMAPGDLNLFITNEQREVFRAFANQVTT